MKIITFNANGIRSAQRKGFFDWAAKQHADVICVQELKAQDEQLDDLLLQLDGYEFYHHCAVKKGYSGVGIYTRKKPDQTIDDFGWDLSHHEGRYLQADFGDLSVISVYLPSGSSGDERQAVKFQFLQEFEKHLIKLLKKKQHYIICGDWNIVHKEIDIKNFKANQKNSGCLPEERAWLDHLFNDLKFVDAFREVNQLPEQYTWWSQRGRARQNNVGWRIDYHIISQELKSKVKRAEIYTKENFSDHAPLIIEYAL